MIGRIAWIFALVFNGLALAFGVVMWMDTGNRSVGWDGNEFGPWFVLFVLVNLILVAAPRTDDRDSLVRLWIRTRKQRLRRELGETESKDE